MNLCFPSLHPHSHVDTNPHLYDWCNRQASPSKLFLLRHRECIHHHQSYFIYFFHYFTRISEWETNLSLASHCALERPFVRSNEKKQYCDGSHWSWWLIKRPSLPFNSFTTIRRRSMSTSFLQQKYAVQNATGNRSMGGPSQPNGIRATVDPRFDTLMNRATVSGRSNQISPEMNIDITSSSMNSTAMLGTATQE